MQLERRAIRSLADEVDRLQQNSMQAMAEPDSRRSFLKKVGVGGAVLTVGGAALPGGLMSSAFAQEDDSSTTEEESGEEGTGGVPTDEGGDARASVLYVQTVELAVVEIYGAAADRFEALEDDELRSVAETFGGHHQEHADAISANMLVQSEAQKGETVADEALLSEIRPTLEAAADVNAVAEVLRDLEERLCATYYELMGVLVEAADAKAVALMLPVDAQHAVVWSTAIGLEQSEYLFTFQAESTATPFVAGATPTPVEEN